MHANFLKKTFDRDQKFSDLVSKKKLVLWDLATI
jgi:hypothetical protein